MSIATDIAKTVHRLRSLPDVDIERLSYELSELEWHEFGREIDKCNPNALDFSYTDRCMFMGLTIRRASQQPSFSDMTDKSRVDRFGR